MLPPPRPSRPAASVHPDDAIRATDDDAAVCRLSAAQLGYLADPYASLVYKLPRLAGGNMRKAPLINVGTHHRTAALDAVVDSFLKAARGKVQVVSLGAGSDTRFWRLAERGAPVARYVEVDFPHLTAMKAQRIARNRTLTAALASSSDPPSSMVPPSKAYTVSHGGAALTAANYALVPLDLRTSSLDELLPLLDTSLPTLLLAECVFCYMEESDSRAVIKWFGSTFPRSAAVIYEMVGLNDAFGRVMHRNLAQRNLSLPGAVFESLQAQADRFMDARLGDGAFTWSGAKSLWDVRGDLPKAELARISKLEILDEIEELRLVLSHYCVAWASKGEGMEGVRM
ncbi:uncharacterized protein CcaverHIS019_0602000 [Cutaneotrichosporon cavernicola]|uniref:Leucine carboxyl methyltransferase 1 n=1 Tax=Cutaneotrichosporon cavernicola TaxID=279322 RepID=A0AA48L7W9_9TREE|nr:uncharacterized protein CcaverHIS019_0602000 [Cutaneotrichosporon cavernicola]BEI93741.1 hypothetical protein CcaverHIS019_0602000 [Cutaneotrichosporon cavernicola]BEJ01519.1 hypothetical protein CcaverHIS631_0602010 [Cutaneotrichosporon cavernicola]BEJ09284.1 hypothetical protein CcaverHIS641_0601990 [Cutaneotrichosporon cavernicola]